MNLANEFFLSTSKGRRYLLGRNVYAEGLLPLFEIEGIVDDFTSENIWHGKPIIKAADLPEDAIVVNCSFSISPILAAEKLDKLTISGHVYYADIYRAHPEIIPVPDFVEQMHDDFQINQAKWLDLKSRLADDISKSLLEHLIQYRLSADPRYMSTYSVRIAEQYFEDFLQLDREVFVDAGGFNGDTTEEFCKRCANYKKVFLFEPSQKNMRDARLRLATHLNIEFIEQGVSDADGLLWFSPDAGSASAIHEDGACSISVTTIDNYIKEPVSFIKMDLEGWELKALHGAQKHILQDHPKMAIAVYHQASDFWRIPEYILGLRQDYDVYLRHYTQGWSETIMFFVPKYE